MSDAEARPQAVTGVLLAGGRARRMGGTDKGLIELAGRPLAAYALERLRPQVDAIVINANRHGDDYAALGADAVVPDPMADYPGPLAGLLAGMQAAQTPWVVTAPCDSPFVPRDLLVRLRAALEAADAELAVAHDGERQQPVFLLAPSALASDLEAWLDEGGRKIDAWFAGHRVADADFSDVAPGPTGAFRNINTPDERDEVAAYVAAGEIPE